MKPTSILALAALLAATSPAYSQSPAPTKEEAKVVESTTTPATTKEDQGPKIQLAILLDTSGSMSGLINQARTQLWKIVNEFISAKQDGKTPFVEVALYEYGKSTLSRESHWVRQIQPLTRDLDKISEELFALTTNGGEEYCGAVIKHAVESLKWDASHKTYKAIFIAGNEPFTQGPISPSDSCKLAISKGIIVNTIHCGNEAEGRQGQWHTGATLADGNFLNIDQNAAMVAIKAPQDEELVRLSTELNKTYLWYGHVGALKSANQEAQDRNAAAVAASGAAVQRCVSKASANYWNGDADLVDACKDAKFELAKVKEEDLPEALKKLTLEERKKKIEEMTEKRAEFQKKIQELTIARDAYVAEQQKKAGKETLDSAISKAVRQQAATKQIVWDK